MTDKEKKVIFSIVAVMMIILVIVIMKSGKKNKKTKEDADSNQVVKEEFVKLQEDGTKVNTSSKLAETKKFDGLEISNITLTEKGNESYIRATVKNTTSQIKGDDYITLTIVDKSGNTLTKVDGYLDTLQPGATATLSIKASADFANAYDFKVSK